VDQEIKALLKKPMPERQRVTAVILTKNEEARIARCLESVRWADEIVVVDGLSTDRTVEICQAYGAKVIAHPFSGDFGAERNLGAEAASGEWILQLDGDDVVSEELQTAITHVLTEGTTHAAFQLRRKNNFLGHWMMRGGWYHYYQMFYRKDACRFEGRVHHVLKIRGTIGTLDAPVLHFPFTSLEQFVSRQNRYTSLEAREILDTQGVLDQRFVRYQVRWRPVKLFWKSFVKKQGFREGWYGLVFATLYAWVHFLKWAKYWELVRDRYQPAAPTPAMASGDSPPAASSPHLARDRDAHVIIPQPQPFVDERGAIQNLVEVPFGSALVITSVKGAVRGNHYHKTDYHYAWLQRGGLIYYHRPVGDTAPPKRWVITPGQIFYTPPMYEHAMHFTEDAVLIVFARNTRQMANYEEDVVRIPPLVA